MASISTLKNSIHGNGFKNKIEKLGLTVVSEDNYVFESGRNSDYYAGDISHVEITVTREYADEYGDDDEITETYRFDANGYGAVREGTRRYGSDKIGPMKVAFFEDLKKDFEEVINN